MIKWRHSTLKLSKNDFENRVRWQSNLLIFVIVQVRNITDIRNFGAKITILCNITNFRILLYCTRWQSKLSHHSLGPVLLAQSQAHVDPTNFSTWDDTPTLTFVSAVVVLEILIVTPGWRMFGSCLGETTASVSFGSPRDTAGRPSDPRCSPSPWRDSPTGPLEMEETKVTCNNATYRSYL